MAIVVEDGTGKTDANSYVSSADLTTYANNRSVTLSGGDEILYKAMDYIESQPFAGDKYTDEQALQWPRTGVYLYGFTVNYDEIPQLLIDAVCEAAIAIDGGAEPLAALGRTTSSESVGPISVSYEQGGREQTYMAACHAKLDRLLSGQSMRVGRG
jgi:hypothetical protein